MFKRVPMPLYAALAATLCLSLFSAEAMAQDRAIRVGYLPQVHDAANFAVERELGKKYKVEYIKFLRYTDIEVALSRGDIDMSSTGYSTAIASAVRGADPKFVFVAGMSRGAVNLVCRPDVEIKDWADLKGRTFGVLTGGTAQIFFDDALDTHGIDPNSVERVSFTAPGPPLLQALQSKNIECMGAYEPFSAKSVFDGYGYYPPTILSENHFIGINGAFAVNTEFLAANPKIVQEAVDIVLAATAAYNDDHAKWVEDVAPRINFDADIVKVAVEHVILDSDLYQMRTVKLANVMKNLGFIKKAPSEETISAYFDYRFISAATGKEPDELGRNK